MRPLAFGVGDKVMIRGRGGEVCRVVFVDTYSGPSDNLPYLVLSGYSTEWWNEDALQLVEKVKPAVPTRVGLNAKDLTLIYDMLDLRVSVYKRSGIPVDHEESVLEKIKAMRASIPANADTESEADVEPVERMISV